MREIPSGIITQTIATISGDQEGEISTVGAQTEQAQMVVKWGDIAMTFTSARQAQYILGYFGMSRQGTMDVLPHIPLPPAPAAAHEWNVGQLIAVTWVRTPHGVSSREAAFNPDLRRKHNYIALQVGPIRFRILDRAGLQSAIELLTRAHKVAVATFLDGEDAKANPLAMSWRPETGHYEQRGQGWVTQ